MNTPQSYVVVLNLIWAILQIIKKNSETHLCDLRAMLSHLCDLRAMLGVASFSGCYEFCLCREFCWVSTQRLLSAKEQKYKLKRPR